MSQDGPGDSDPRAPVPVAPTEGGSGRGPATRTEGEGETLDMPEGFQSFTSGQVLGERYQILEMLGRGGMGEVWHAFDLKLRVEVALKALRGDLFKSERRLELLRQEVRAAREVVSPNVCRIFDLIEVEGRELVSMEYVDGATLLGVLQERGPLELKEAQDIASQFLAGLEAIHKVGLIHRDIKPENIMLTRAGRVVVMDFGLARQETEGGGSVSGTPAYMAPEQAAGQTLDARADVYAAGVVLAEMVSPDGIKSYESRQSVWEGVRSEPAKLPDSPWAPAIKKAVAKDRGGRYNSAHTLTRALEDVTLRVEGAEDLHPYPGLASFTEDDAEYFFGREAEVEQMWRKLEGPPRMLGLVGQSGAGKSSFIGAGVLANAPVGWSLVVCTPGNAAISSLGRVIAREMAGDADVVEKMMDFDDPDVAVEVLSRWSRRTDRALLVVDQFEELFTQNTPDEQRRFSELLGRIVLDANACVVLSMRDDFLMRCRDEESLGPIFADMTALPTLSGAALRRALVQPATKCGYRFEDDELVDEMLAEVEGERGALPLLAFAAARLWEKRDRETGLLTRQAYHDIGGVGGAMARHAEATIDRIGTDHIAVVRELFRNLVTSEGTRAVREWNELLSVFSDSRSESPEEILRELIDSRLLTSYEIHEDEREPTRQVEIIHESLLANWPRLVRWQTQDHEGAQLRDELRQAARTWEEHDRANDRLWAGTAYREYQLWRERYPGGLTGTEEAFGEAMTRHAERRKRRRRTAVAASFVILLIVLVIIGSFWRRSVTEARRAEAANLFSLAQLRLEDHPTAAVAYSIASLDLADNPEVRRLALDALWRGPTEFRLPTASPYSLDFSPDGRWLATADPVGGGKLWPSDGGPPTALEGSDVAMEIRFSPGGDLVAAPMDTERQQLGLWSVPEGQFLRSFALGDQGLTAFFRFSRDGERLFTSTESLAVDAIELEFRSWSVEGGEPDLLAHLELPTSSSWTQTVDPAGSRFSWADGRRVRIARLEGTTLQLASARSIDHDRTIAGQTFDEQGRQLATSDTAGTIRVWSLERDPPELTHTLSGEGGESAVSALFDPSGSMLAGGGFLWDLTAAPDAEPLRVRSSYGLAFDPSSRWLATGGTSVSLCPLARTYSQVLRGHEQAIMSVALTPDGKRLVSTSEDGSVRVWPLGGSSGEGSRILHQTEGTYSALWQLAMSPNGSFVATGSPTGRVVVLPLDGGPVRDLGGFTDFIDGVAVGPKARLVAAGAGRYIRGEAFVRVWDLESGEVRILDARDGKQIDYIEFTGGGDLLVDSGRYLRRWDLAGVAPRILDETDLSGPEQAGFLAQDLSPDGHQVLFIRHRRLWIHDLEEDTSRELGSHGAMVVTAAFDPSGKIVVSADARGTVRVGPVTGEEPHLLVGHKPYVTSAAVSPDGRWIALGDNDGTIRLWPMPDFAKPPLHTLPHDELLAKLRSLTNLRVVEDPDSPSGWKLEVGPFPGWETVPTW